MAIGNVAPLAQTPSYSDMVEKQVGLINRERAANLQNRLAQEESNREFRTEQLQNIYDFDVSGLAPGDAANMAELQKTLADRLDPSSENAYSDSQQLIADLALVNNLYSAGKRWGQTGTAGRQGYAQSIVNPDRGDGTTYVSNEDTLQARNSTWEKGASSGFRIEGGPGETRLISTYLDQDGQAMGEGDYFQNPWYSQPDQFWRAEIGEAPPMNVAGIYADDPNIDATNVEARSSNRWDSNPTKVQQAFRNSKAKAEGLSPNELKNEDGTYIDGYTDEQLKAEYQAEAANGLSLRKQAVAPPLFSGSVYDLSDEVGGGRAFELESPVDVRTSLVSGTVSHIRLEGDSMTVVFQNLDDEIEEVTVEEGSDAWQTIMDKAGGLPALRAMQLKNGGTPAAEEAPAEGGTPAAEEAPAAEVSVEDTVNDLDAQALALEAIIEEAGPLNRGTDLQTAAAVQEAQANLREVNERRNALVEAPVGSSNAGFNEYLEEVTNGIRWNIANTVTQNLAKELKGLTPVEQSSKLEDKYNELEASWTEISNKPLENMSSRDKAKVKNLDGQMREVEEMKSKLGFAAESPVESNFVSAPPVDPLPLLQAAPENDWYSFDGINANMTEDQRSLVGYLVHDHEISPQAAVALTSVTAKEASGNAAKKEGSYYAKGKRPDGTEMNSLEQIKKIFTSSMGDDAPNPLTQAELDEARSEGKEYFDSWFFDRVYGPETYQGKKLGNTEPGDGYKFRGRGLIQFTGRTNYAAASKFLFGDPDVLTKNPEILAEDPNLGARAAAWYLMRNGQLKNSDLTSRENLSIDDALALADSSYALVAGESAFTSREVLEQRVLYPKGSAGQRAWLNIN
jgi:hypothetical protein